MRIVLTGATGFLGSHLTRGLVAAGHSVTAAVRGSSDLGRLEDLSAGIRFVNLDREGPGGLFTVSELPGAVIHTATDYGRDPGEGDRVKESNLVFPLDLLKETAGHGVRVFINTDTFYPRDHPVLPDYAQTKKQFVDQGRVFFRGQGRKFINLRLQHLYGPGDSESKFIPYLVNSCLQNIPEIPLTDGTQRRDFIYVSDAVEAYLSLLKRAGEIPEGFHQFDAGTGASTTVRTMAEKVREKTGSGSSLLFGALPGRHGELADSKADTARLMELGWHPRVSLDEGIALTVDYYSGAGKGRTR